jgi:hypothetical protein
MNYKIFKNISLFISSFIFFFLFYAPLSSAGQIDSDLTRQIIPAEGLKSLKASPGERAADSVIQAVAVARQIESAFDFKIHLNERFNAIFSLEKPFNIDVASRDTWKNYNALIGFQIILR